MDLEFLEIRAHIIREVRSFFDRRAYLETDTPLLSPDLIPESCLEVFETAYTPPKGAGPQLRANSQLYWLIPSPEIWMKKIIARHRKNIYQICKCFRNGESRGRLHSSEFTMLEYYTMNADYCDSLAITEALFEHLLILFPPQDTQNSSHNTFKLPFERITMEEAFLRWAGFSLFDAAEAPVAGAATLEAQARKLGLDPPPGLDNAALYDLIFIHAVEPNLPKDRFVALIDYPAFVPCLARKRQDGRTVERWELYYRGIELANCYSEETDPYNVKAYFEAEAAVKEKTALVPHRVDSNYWEIFLPRKKNLFGRKPRSDRCGRFRRQKIRRRFSARRSL